MSKSMKRGKVGTLRCSVQLIVGRHLVRFHCQKCRRRICSFRYGAALETTGVARFIRGSQFYLSLKYKF